MSAPATPALRFEKEYEYDNGDAYRVWVFEVDRPDITTERLNMGAMHVVAGDKLVQDEDEGRPFRIKRRGRTIANKEWWQIEDLFPDGLPLWSGEEQADAEPEEDRGILARTRVEYSGAVHDGWEVLEESHGFAKGTLLFRMDGRWVWGADGMHPNYVAHEYEVDNLIRWHLNRVDPLRRAALALIAVPGSYMCSAELAVEAIPGTPVEAGDLVLLRNSNKWPLPAVRGRLVPLTLEHHERIRAHFEQRAGRYALHRHAKVFDARKKGETLPIVNTLPSGFGTYHGSVAQYIAHRRGWGAKRKNWVSDLWVVKRVSERVLPIEARSEDAALFELLAEVGGRLPVAGAR